MEWRKIIERERGKCGLEWGGVAWLEGETGDGERERQGMGRGTMTGQEEFGGPEPEKDDHHCDPPSRTLRGSRVCVCLRMPCL